MKKRESQFFLKLRFKDDRKRTDQIYTVIESHLISL